MGSTRWSACCLCAWGAIAALGVGSASAQPRPRPAGAQAGDATVVQIDGEDVYVDLGGTAISAGATLTVLRPIETRHPVTRAVLRDSFPIGRLVVMQVGESMSIARVSGSPHRPVQLGDLARPPAVQAPVAQAASPPEQGARVVPLGQAAPPPLVCPPAPAPTPCPVQRGADPRVDEILRVWSATFGLLPEARIRVWSSFLAVSGSSPYARYARAEMEAAQRELARGRAEGPTDGALAELAPLTRAYEGEPVAFAGIVTRGIAVRDLSVYARARGGDDGLFTRVPMVLDAAGHARAEVPSALVVVPGFEWFAEITLADGRTALVAAGPIEPYEVEVWPSLDAPDESGRSRVRFSTDYVDFNRSRLNDYYVAVEGDFTYRLGIPYLQSVRVGYGHLQGESGPVDGLDTFGSDGLSVVPAQAVGFTYGFVEPELALHEMFAVALRITAGLGLPQHRVDGLRGGAQLRFRIGSALGTNLVLAGETIPELGLRGYIGLAWLPVADWPMSAEVHVTDQPRNGDIAVRGVFEVGHRFGQTFALSTRLSYQGRNINHSGFGVGLAATFDW